MNIAGIAFSIMNANYSATFWTFVFFFLFLKEFFHSIFFNISKIINRAHVKSFAIFSIKFLYLFARKIVAFVTIFNFFFSKFFAILFKMCTAFSTWITPNTLHFSFITTHRITKETNAYSKVHSARCN